MSKFIPSMRLVPRGFARGVVLLAGFAGLLAHPGQAATIMGSGITFSCGGWVEVRKTPERNPVQEWSLGYLSGVAMWSPASPLDGLDVGAVMVWLDNFCQQNPLVPFRGALDEFVRQRVALANRQQQLLQQQQQQQQQQPQAQPRPAPPPAQPPALVPGFTIQPPPAQRR